MNGDDETPWTIQMSRPAQKALRRLPSERDRLLRGITVGNVAKPSNSATSATLFALQT